MSISKKLLANFFPRYSLIVDQVNHNAKLGAWIKKNAAIPQFSGREQMYAFLNERYLGAPMDFLEFGVFEGASLKEWTGLHKNPQSRFFGFDSFEGLPEDWGRNLKAAAFSLGGQIPALGDPRIQLVKGWFQDSLPPFLGGFTPQGQLALHIDSDLHSSAIYVLTRMDHLIGSGTVIIFDEFASALHEFRALDDYCRAYRRSVRPLAMTSDFAAQAAFIVD
jgi:O-methyltransferase